MRAMPNEADIKPDELFCFLNRERVCGADCMAYTTFAPNHADYNGQQWPHCSLLLNLHRTGKHLVVIAECISKLMKTDHRQAAAGIQPPETK